MARDKFPRIVPPPAPVRFWMTDELRPFQDRIDDGDVLKGDAWVQYCRLRGLEDMYFFGKYIFGFDWLEPELHAPLAYAWSAPNGTTWLGPDGAPWTYDRERMAIVPRGHLKTTLLTQTHAGWKITKNPEERGLIYTSNYMLGCGMLAAIRARLEGHGPYGQFYLACYGDRIPTKQQRSKWSENQLTLNRQGSYTEPTLMASGVGGTLTGHHFTFQDIDDLVGDELSREQMDKVCRAVDNLTPMLADLRTSEQRFCGTHWAFYDVLHYLKRYKPKMLVAQRAWKEDGKLIFSRCDEEQALSLKRRNPFLFSCWYESSPSDSEKVGFQRQWFRYFRRQGNNLIEMKDGKEQRTLDAGAMHTFMFIDPNTGERPGARGDANTQAQQDYVGIIVLHVNKENQRYVSRAIRARWNVDEFVQQVFRLVDYWQPKFVAIEQVAAQRLFFHIFQMHFRQGRPPFQLIPWEGGRTSKNERIRGLVDFYANGLVWHQEEDGTGGIQALEGELEDFPNAEYDDLSDALSASLKLAYPPGRTQPSTARVMSQRERDLSKLDAGSRRVWEILHRNETVDTWSLGKDFWTEGSA